MKCKSSLKVLEWEWYKTPRYWTGGHGYMIWIQQCPHRSVTPVETSRHPHPRTRCICWEQLQSFMEDVWRHNMTEARLLQVRILLWKEEFLLQPPGK